MEENTTTNAPVDDGGVQTIQGIPVDDQGQAVPQPEDTEPAEAVAPATEPAEETQAEPNQEASVEEEPSNDDNSAIDWLKKKGIDPNSPEALEKVADMYRNAEKKMHSTAQTASELEKASRITEDQIPEDATPELRDSFRVRNLELLYATQQWKMQNPDKLVSEPAMAKVLSDPTKRALVQEGFLSLDDVYSIAQGGNTQSAKSQGKREALANLAQNQQAAVPRGNATNSSAMNSSTTITPQNVDQMVAQMTPEEYRKRLPEINAALA